ncbi:MULTISPECIES: hypothetical protein [Micromonospora]|uniref:hypothetical protein n=1 Tax=Micromonospora TaxID=1873 RepID=UPI00371857F6
MYLALCIKAGVPKGETADRLRAELLAVRDAKRKADVPVSPIALGLTVLRHWGHPITEKSVVLAELQSETGPVLGFLLAGRVFVSASSRGAKRRLRHPGVWSTNSGSTLRCAAKWRPFIPSRHHRPVGVGRSRPLASTSSLRLKRVSRR